MAYILLINTKQNREYAKTFCNTVAPTWPDTLQGEFDSLLKALSFLKGIEMHSTLEHIRKVNISTTKVVTKDALLACFDVRLLQWIERDYFESDIIVFKNCYHYICCI